jgi:competence protein ComEC
MKRLVFACFLIILAPLYLFRLSQTPVYQIPENKEIKIIGRITQQPYLKGSNQIIRVGPITVKTEIFPKFLYGQRVEIVGKFTSQVIGPFQRRFFANYPAIRLAYEDGKNGGKADFLTFLTQTRGHLENSIAQLLPEPQASLLTGIVFGVKKQMPIEFWESLRRTGTLHIVVASGQNINIVAWFLIELLTWVISRRKAVLMATLGVTFYILLIGAEPPVVRAGIMAVMAYLALVLGRESDGTLGLLLAAAIMLLAQPLLLFDISFLLSFAATAGILWFYPILRQKRPFSFRFGGIALATTMAAQIGVLPLLLIFFGQVSILSPLINVLVVWTVPILMALGLVLALLGLFLKPLAIVLGWFAWLLLTYFVKVVEISGSLPWMFWEVGQISSWWAAGYYSVLGYLVWRYQKRERS